MKVIINIIMVAVLALAIAGCGVGADPSFSPDPSIGDVVGGDEEEPIGDPLPDFPDPPAKR